MLEKGYRVDAPGQLNRQPETHGGSLRRIDQGGRQTRRIRSAHFDEGETGTLPQYPPQQGPSVGTLYRGCQRQHQKRKCGIGRPDLCQNG